jgi:CRP/FNR family cyclic AMP-dependent transcriptional regulator
LSTKRIFTALTEAEENSILEACDSIVLSKGEILFKKGDETNALYIVSEGELSVLDEIPGQRVFLAGLHEGEIFGEMSFLDERPRSASVQAVTDSVVLRFTKENFIRLVIEAPETGARFMITIGKFLVDRLRRADTALTSMTKSGYRIDDEIMGKLKSAVSDYRSKV